MSTDSQNITEPQYDARYFATKMRLFERVLDPQATQALKAELGDRFHSDEVVSWQDIVTNYPHYLRLVVDRPELAEFALKYLPEVSPFLQCPFPLAGQQVVQGQWNGIYKVQNFPLCGITRETVEDRRVLDLGCNAGYDTFYLSSLGAAEVIGVEPAPLFYFQALYLWSMYYCPNLRFINTGWQRILPQVFGEFDIVNCQGVLYHEPSPMALIEALFDLLAPGGTLVLESHVSLQDDTTALLVENTFNGGIDWWWLPTMNATCAMLRTRGFTDVQVRTWAPSPSGNPDDPMRTIEGLPAGGRAFFTARRPENRVVATPKYYILK